VRKSALYGNQEGENAFRASLDFSVFIVSYAVVLNPYNCATCSSGSQIYFSRSC